MVGPTDPQWNELDREYALAYQLVESGRCNGCGTHKDEWEDDRFAYVAQAWVCPGCENLENERHNDPSKDGTPGRKTYLLPRQVSEMLEAMETEGAPGEPGSAGRTDGERE